MLKIRNANIQLFKHNMSVCHISFNRGDQDFDTLKTLGRSNMLFGYELLKEVIIYKNVRFYPE